MTKLVRSNTTAQHHVSKLRRRAAANYDAVQLQLNTNSLGPALPDGKRQEKASGGKKAGS